MVAGGSFHLLLHLLELAFGLKFGLLHLRIHLGFLLGGSGLRLRLNLRNLGLGLGFDLFFRGTFRCHRRLLELRHRLFDDRFQFTPSPIPADQEQQHLRYHWDHLRDLRHHWQPFRHEFRNRHDGFICRRLLGLIVDLREGIGFHTDMEIPHPRILQDRQGGCDNLRILLGFGGLSHTRHLQDQGWRVELADDLGLQFEDIGGKPGHFGLRGPHAEVSEVGFELLRP